MATFGQILRHLRTKRGLTQTELGKAVGLKYSTISMYERGQREPDLDILSRIAAYFGVSLDYLNGTTTPPPQSTTSYVEAVSHSPHLLAMAKRYGVSPDYILQVTMDDKHTDMRLEDGTGKDGVTMHYMHLTDREYELIYAYRCSSETQKEINRILDRPTPAKKKKPTTGSGK